MIKVIERKDEPRATVTCDNCHSILKYGNCDLHAHIYVPNWSLKLLVDYYYLYCPVCNCRIKVAY